MRPITVSRGAVDVRHTAAQEFLQFVLADSRGKLHLWHRILSYQRLQYGFYMNSFSLPKERVVVAVAAFLVSLLFLLFGPYSNFAAAGYLDPWFYTGYFTNFSYMVHHYGPTHFVARLPWIIPGIFAFRVFATPEVASVVLNLAIAMVSLIALYWAVRWHYGWTPAVLACAALITNPYFISTVSWDYPDGPAIAFAFAGLAFAVRPHGNPVSGMIRAGIFLTLSALTSLSAVPMLLSILVLVFWRHRQSAQQWKLDALRVAIGAAATLLVLCVVAQVLVGKWTFFYWPVFHAIQTYGDPAVADKMGGAGGAFLLTASRLLAPVILLVAGAILLRRRKGGAMAGPAWLGLAVCCGLYTVLQLLPHGSALRVPYQSSYLIVPAFFLAGVLFGEMGALTARWTAVVVALAAVLPFWHDRLVELLPVWPVLMILGAAVAIATGPARQACMVAMLFLAPGLDSSINYMWDRPAGTNLETFRSLMGLQDYLKSTVHPERRVQFWIDQDEETPMFSSAEALYLWIHNDFTRDLTAAPAAQVREELKPNATLVHLTMHAERMDARRKLLAARGITVGNERTTTLPWATVVLQDVTDLSGLK